MKEVSKLTQELNGQIIVAGSLQLARTLIENNLVDELRLMVYPVLLGAVTISSAKPATNSPCVFSTPGQ